jgi:hypothetical protein
MWSILGKVIQNNARFALTYRLEVHLDHVTMSAGNGKRAEKTRGRTLDVLSAIKRNIVTVKAALSCLAHALRIVMAKANNDLKYASYRDGYSLKEPVKDLLKAFGVDLSNGGVLKNFRSCNNTFVLQNYCLID